jgi:uncharacterized protein YdaU (DUF1376 family)
MNKSPAFQFYPSDWLGSQRVSLMTLEEEGAYIRLLAYCWQHGSVPADPEAVARLIGKGATTTLASRVLTMFQPPLQPPLNGGTVLVHERLEEERSKQFKWKEKSSEGGRKSAELRKSRVVQPPLEPPLQPNGNITSSSSSSINIANAILSNAEKVEVKKPMKKREQKQVDAEWLADLKRHYPDINLDSELGKMKAWCETNNRDMTRKFIIGWLNRVTPVTLPKAEVKSEWEW